MGSKWTIQSAGEICLVKLIRRGYFLFVLSMSTNVKSVRKLVW